jgi:adenine-specific DNA-methyltransferase
MAAVEEAKNHGIHYTPSALAMFLARRSLAACDLTQPLIVLDPACGDGELLAAVAAIHPEARLYGVDRDAAAVAQAQLNLEDIGVTDATFVVSDFLDLDPAEAVASFGVESFDLVISNPPYVRTQVMGAERAQELAVRFGLTGRVDLYQVFAHATSEFLHPQGILGLLCSNRFLSVLSGEALRALLTDELIVREIFDLGDTKLFAAAVLPAIVIAERPSATVPASKNNAKFVRVYERSDSPAAEHEADDLLASLESGITGVVKFDGKSFEIERGDLVKGTSPKTPWMLVHKAGEAWLETVDAHTAATFESLGKIRVGIKTTADSVFIRTKWDDLPGGLPEAGLLRPLLTHHVAERWRATPTQKSVLYPHIPTKKAGKQQPIELEDFPVAAAYLESHRNRLEGRTYVIEGGRQWFEIWVPQDPAAWSKTKIVFPDISDVPRFFLDKTGAIVNGDCYWMTFGDDADPEVISLMLAVANSTFAVAFYDTVCGNRLYAGRRRFITQYVKRFPIPKVGDEARAEIHKLVCELVEGTVEDASSAETMLDTLIWTAFGLTAPAAS